MNGHDDASGWWSAETLRMLAGEAAAAAQMALAMPLRPFLSLDDAAPAGIHATPVVLVHGLFGDPTNFMTLRSFLAARGIRRFATFSYLPRIDYPRLATRLADRIEAVRRDTGAEQVDVVAHSLGGSIARYLIETEEGARVRRLVTLGSPYWTTPHPAQELAIYAEHDPVVPPPAASDRRRRTLIVGGCGHLGLLRNQRALRATAQFLTLSGVVPSSRPRIAA